MDGHGVDMEAVRPQVVLIGLLAVVPVTARGISPQCMKSSKNQGCAPVVNPYSALSLCLHSSLVTVHAGILLGELRPQWQKSFRF